MGSSIFIVMIMIIISIINIAIITIVVFVVFVVVVVVVVVVFSLLLIMQYVTGEDPVLGSVMAEAYVRGVQSQHVMAVVKHFILNNQETNRTTVNAIVDERTLHEIYLPPFLAAIEAGMLLVLFLFDLFSCSHA
jgi:hypothetical protein